MLATVKLNKEAGYNSRQKQNYFHLSMDLYRLSHSLPFQQAMKPTISRLFQNSFCNWQWERLTFLKHYFVET